MILAAVKAGAVMMRTRISCISLNISVSPRQVSGRYADGCNGILTCRTASLGSLRFDERLPLYGWQEDLDFCAGLRRSGRIVKTNRVWGVHLGTKRGKGSEIRLGYSQIANPAYIVSKGNMSAAFAFRLATCNFIANLVKSIRSENHVDRRGRLVGNLIGMFHLMTGRLAPEHILKLNEFRRGVSSKQNKTKAFGRPGGASNGSAARLRADCPSGNTPTSATTRGGARMSWSRDRHRIRTMFDAATSAWCKSNSREITAIASVLKLTRAKRPL